MGNFKEKMQDLTSAAVGPTLDIVADTLVEGVAGAVIPGVGNMILSYKQNRMERRVEETLQMLVDRQDELNAAINNLSGDMAKQIQGKYFEMLMDYSIDEPQEEKIKYLVNGYINMARIQNPQEDVARSFYDTLAQMNMLDIRVFKLYTFSVNDNAYQIMEDYNIDTYQYDMIREKLARLGLIYSMNDMQRDKNIDGILAYLEDLSKGKKAKLKAKRVSRSDSFWLSSYGDRFIRFIESAYDGKENTVSDEEQQAISPEIQKFLHGE